MRLKRASLITAMILTLCVPLFAFQNCSQTTKINLSQATHYVAAAAPLHVKEGDTTHLLIPFLDTFAAGTIVHWSIAQGPVGHNPDFDLHEGDYIFPAAGKNFTLPALALLDGVYEGEEPIVVSFKMDDGSVFPDVTIIIDDGDPVPTLQSAIEQVDAGDPVTIPFVLSQPSLTDTVIQWATADGTALGNKDYTQAAGTVTIPAGQTQATVMVATTLQPEFVSQTAFAVNFSGQGLIDVQPAAVTVLLNASNPDELPPVLSIAPVSPTVNDGQNQIFTASLSHLSDLPVTFSWNLIAGSAVFGIDLNAQSGTVTIPPGSLTAQVSVATLPDPYFELEPHRAYTLNVGSILNALNTSTSAVGTIIDHVPTPTLSITQDKTVYAPGDLATITFTLSNKIDGVTTLNWSTADATATAGVEYQANSGTLTFPRGTTVQTSTVQWLHYMQSGSFNFTINASVTIAPP